MSSPSGATPAIGTSLFDAEGPGGAVENVTGAAAGTANAGSDGLFGTSPHLSAMVGAGGLFDSDSGPSQSLLDGPAPAVAAPMVLANDDVSGAAMDADLAELRKTYEESNSLFASMGVDGGQRSPSKPRSAHTDAAAAGAGDAPVPPPPAEEIGGEATAGSGAPAPQLSGDQAHDDEVGQGGAAPAVSSRRWQGRGGPGLFDADGDATDVYAEGGGSAHALGFSGSIAATTKEQLLEMVAALRPRVAELEAELKETYVRRVVCAQVLPDAADGVACHAPLPNPQQCQTTTVARGKRAPPRRKQQAAHPLPHAARRDWRLRPHAATTTVAPRQAGKWSAPQRETRAGHRRQPPARPPPRLRPDVPARRLGQRHGRRGDENSRRRAASPWWCRWCRRRRWRWPGAAGSTVRGGVVLAHARRWRRGCQHAPVAGARPDVGLVVGELPPHGWQRRHPTCRQRPGHEVASSSI